jgi:hypothetical protein
MAVGTTTLTSLYEDIVADLIPYYDNAVLLPNPSLIVNSYNLEGSVGNQVKVPVTGAWTSGGSSLTENASIIAAAGEDFAASNVILSVNKRGAGSKVSNESLEDVPGTVAQGTTTRLARSIAQNTDIAGFRVFLSGAETALTDISDCDLVNDGHTNAVLDGSTNELALVFSPEAGSYASKRTPTVKMFEDIDTDSVEFVATVRNGFAQIKTDYIRAVATSNVIGAASSISASLDQFSTSIAHLRDANAPTDAGGFYIACVTPGQELALAKELNGVGGISSGSIGSVAQMAANDALLQGLISVAIGARFVRSNNLPRNLLTA